MWYCEIMNKKEKNSIKTVKRSTFQNGSVGLIVSVLLTAFLMVGIFILLLVSKRGDDGGGRVPAVVRAGEDSFDDTGACRFNQFTRSSEEGVKKRKKIYFLKEFIY